MPKTVLITGASHGLGYETAMYFSRNGWNVTACWHTNRSGAYTLKDKTGCRIIRCDVSDRNNVRGMMRSIGELGAVINNAGINKDSLLLKTHTADWERIIGVNLTGVFNVCREALKIMRRAGGHIVNVSSLAGVTGRAGQCAYSASKAGIIGFSKTLAKEAALYSIKVNTLLPGYMRTDMLPETFVERAERENILGRINAPEDTAQFIYYIVQTDFISGQVFNLDSRIIPRQVI